MKTSQIPTPPSQGKYKCKLSEDSTSEFDVYYGNTWIGMLMSTYSNKGWGIAKTMFIVDSDTSRLTSKDDLLYFVACIDFLNQNAQYPTN